MLINHLSDDISAKYTIQFMASTTIKKLLDCTSRVDPHKLGFIGSCGGVIDNPLLLS